jgi:hypothetical protein
MLLTQRAYLEGSRAFAYWLALHGDRAEHHPDEDERKASHDLLALLTPVVKAFLTDNGFLCTNLAMQIYGGHGYIRDAGMEQYVRDARINMIYEGTNTIQSLDLLGRKVLGDNGAKLRKFGALIKELVEEHGTRDDMAEFINPLADLGDKVEKLTMEIGMKAFGNADEAGAAAVDYLRIIGHLVMGYFWARMARIALDHPDDGGPLLFRAVDARDRRGDPQRPLGRRESDGPGRRAVLSAHRTRDPSSHPLHRSKTHDTHTFGPPGPPGAGLRAGAGLRRRPRAGPGRSQESQGRKS